MTGPDHYRAAEALLNMLERKAGQSVSRGDFDTTCAWAQVHATLALAAATAQNIRQRSAMDAGLADEWVAVTQ